MGTRCWCPSSPPSYEISLQAVSRHIQVLVRDAWCCRARSGRISRCSLDVGPLYEAAVWMNRYSKSWQEQFDTLAATLARSNARPPERARRRGVKRPVPPEITRNWH